MFKKTVLATSVALGMGMAGAAQADLFQFNPTGGGAGAGVINNVATIDEAPGNSLGGAGSVAGGGPLPVGTTITDLYQANLTAMLGASSNVLFANGTGGNFFTFVAGFSETVTTSVQPGGPGTTVS